MSQQDCFVCSKAAPRPSLVCMTCLESSSPNHSSSTAIPHYCSTICRNTDTRKHDSACIEKPLGRAADILQASFHLWREVAFDLKIKKVKKTKGVLHVYEHYYKPNMTDDALFDFPNVMVPDPKDKAALLTYCACDDAAGYMFGFSTMLLSNLTTTIEECYFAIPRSFWTIKRFRGDGVEDSIPYLHATIAIEATNGQSYVIDMGGAQFGQHRALLPFEECVSMYGASVAMIHPHGFYSNEHNDMRSGMKNEVLGESYDFRVLHAQAEIHKTFLGAIKKWEEKEKVKMRQILSCREAEYEEIKVSLLRTMREEMELFMITWKLDGCKIKKHPLSPQQKSNLKLPDWMLEAQREFAGPMECTVQPDGEGSSAYRAFKAGKEARLYQSMPQHTRDFIEQVKANGGHVLHR